MPSAGDTRPPPAEGCARSVVVPMPPVWVPISRESLTRSLPSVPISRKHAVSKGRSGSSSRLTALASKHTSAYTIPEVGSACVRNVTGPSWRTSQGISCPSLSRSSRPSLGSLATSSALSASAWRALRALVASCTASSCSGVIDFLMAASLSDSSASWRASSSVSGTMRTVTRWPFSSSVRLTRSSKTGSPFSRAALSSARGSSKRRPESGSRS
mmetsp:Transcript_10609/g.36002  ORF Transcript_10609/g.36002 Transcript_10609/m.36002 type:complete len:214 (-) Transcript_10609:1440-2081(-)